MPRHGAIYVYENNASGMSALEDNFRWFPCPSHGALQRYMAVPSLLIKVETAVRRHGDTHQLVAYQSLDETEGSVLPEFVPLRAKL